MHRNRSIPIGLVLTALAIVVGPTFHSAAQDRPNPGARIADEKFMRMAILAARKGVQAGGLPFGACIVRNDQVLALVSNSSGKDVDPTAHAEMQAIRAACKRMNGLDLSKSTIYATGEPCVMCFGACFWARIPRIVHGSRIDDIEKAGIRQIKITDRQLKEAGNVPVELAGDFLRVENLALLKLWSARQKPPPQGTGSRTSAAPRPGR